MEEPLQISNVVVRELVSRWSSIDLCFRIREYLVPFSVFYVCLYLGLGVVGEEVNFEHYAPGVVKKLFQDNDITVNTILAKLRDITVNREENVDDFCRLYILLAFCTFYFPRSSRTITIVLFFYLDNLDNLYIYNWGTAIYGFLVQSLNRASEMYNHQKNNAAMQVSGCVALLQVSKIFLTYDIGSCGLYVCLHIV